MCLKIKPYLLILMNSYNKTGCHDAYVEISNKLEGRHIPESFRRGLESLRNAGNKYQVYKLTMNSPDNVDVMRQVIGRNGCYFIMTTQDCDLDFIWHNRDHNTIEFWGPRESIKKATSVIKTRIKKYEEKTTMEKDSSVDYVDKNNVNHYPLLQKMDSLDYVEDNDGGMVHSSWATGECKEHDINTQNGVMEPVTNEGNIDDTNTPNGEIVPDENDGEKEASKLSGSVTGDQ